ncbi:hypothetical protein EIP91_009773 [Steccherinum ochraceum]|uniref:Uncharacterized protein n=1 Tax=Steccherinum ochraceum TaxID=92696 RepID=A0A4V2MV05_9APHY|nr:hypothetical protein EIP91_009773 [Steccherinum ochraceum]
MLLPISPKYARIVEMYERDAAENGLPPIDESTPEHFLRFGLDCVGVVSIPRGVPDAYYGYMVPEKWLWELARERKYYDLSRGCPSASVHGLFSETILEWVHKRVLRQPGVARTVDAPGLGGTVAIFYIATNLRKDFLRRSEYEELKDLLKKTFGISEEPKWFIEVPEDD